MTRQYSWAHAINWIQSRENGDATCGADMMSCTEQQTGDLLLRPCGWLPSLGFFFFFCHVACEILVPWPEIEPVSRAVEVWSPNHWTTRQLPWLGILKCQDAMLLVKLLNEGSRNARMWPRPELRTAVFALPAKRPPQASRLQSQEP